MVFFFPSKPLCSAFSLVCFAAAAFIHATSVDIMRHGHTQATSHPPKASAHRPLENRPTLFIVDYCTWQKFLPVIAMKVPFKFTAPRHAPFFSCSLIERVSISYIFFGFATRQHGQNSKPCLFIPKNNNKLGSEFKKTSTQA